MLVWKTFQLLSVGSSGIIDWLSRSKKKKKKKKSPPNSPWDPIKRSVRKLFHTLQVSVCVSVAGREGQFLYSPLCLSISVSLLQSAVCLDWTYPDEGDFPGKVIWKEKKNWALIVKACSILFLSLCVWACVCVCVCVWVCAFYESSSFSCTLKALCFSSLIIRGAGSLESGLPVHTGVRQGGGEAGGGGR